MPTLRLIESRALTGRARHFAFEAAFAHEAGQYVALSAEVNGNPARRYYSIASPPRPDRRVEFCIHTAGEFGSYLCALLPGTEIECSQPAGNMRLADPGRAAVYFAAGTGIAPIRAILLAHLAANAGADATLVLGARAAGELAYLHEFEALRDRHPRFRLMPTVSREDPGWDGRRGRVTSHVAEATGGRRDLDAYFCGPPEMVADLRERLAAAGIPDERQCFERY